MSDDTLFENDDSEDSLEKFEPDPSVIAHLDQEGAAFEEMADQFESTFGFRHKCRCAEDYSSGNLVEVTECFTTMVSESLEACQQLMQENVMLRMMLTQMFATVPASTEPVEDVDPVEENNDADADDLS